ncbi:MAG: hypothetical protein QOE24_282 [Frankiales bacterium]|nr:hypothetical protein [Frankiales bacterium]
MIIFTVVVAAAAGAICGAVAGVASGIALAICRTWVLGERRRARMVASAASAAPFLLYGLVSGLALGSPLVFAADALAGLFSAAAGAFLAPWVVGGGAFGVRQVGRR